MARTTIEIAEEIGAKKVFAWAIDWPGWARSRWATLPRCRCTISASNWTRP